MKLTKPEFVFDRIMRPSPDWSEVDPLPKDAGSAVIARDRAAVARACAEIAATVTDWLAADEYGDTALIGKAGDAIAARLRALAARLEAGAGVDDE